MPLSNGAKLAIAAAVGIGIFAVARGASAAPPKQRPPYLLPIKVPGNDRTWDDFDDAICFCSQAGETDSVRLVNCSLARVYPEVSWPAQPNDHVSVMRTWQAVGARVADFVAAIERGENPCAVVPETPDEPDEPETPETPDEPETPDTPDAPPTIDPFVTGHAGGFKYIVAGSNPSAWAQQAGGFAAAQTGNIRQLLECAAGSVFNLLFVGRKWNADEYGRHSYGGKFYDINFGWLPRHMNIAALYASDGATRLQRNVGWDSGNIVNGNFRSYFTPWIPQALFVGGVVSCRGADIFAPERNPPAEVLARLGWPGGLAELRTAFLNSPLAP